MKKLFISVPTEGRDEAAVDNSIRRMHQIAEAIFDVELEIIKPKTKTPKLEGEKLNAWLFGESLQAISKADYFIGIHSSLYFDDCDTEATIARQCDIPSTFVSVYDIAPDAVEKASKEFIDEAMQIEIEFEEDPWATWL